MVLTLLKGLGKAYLKSQKGVIKSVKPGTNLGGKTVKQWKSDITSKKLNESIRAAGAQITGKLKKTAAELEKLTTTLKKQKKILDD